MLTITPAIIEPAADEALSEGDFAGLVGLSFFIQGDGVKNSQQSLSVHTYVPILGSGWSGVEERYKARRELERRALDDEMTLCGS